MQKKRLDQKDKVYFEIYDVTAWLTKNCNTHIAQYLTNQTMKFGQLIEYPKINILFKNYTENEAGKLVPDRFLFFQKALYQVKASGLQLDFSIFRQPSNQHTIETNGLKLYTISSV